MTAATSPTARTRPSSSRRAPAITAATLGLPEEPRAVTRHGGLLAHVRATLDVQLRVLLADQGTAGRADQPESVHRMRVATRRMRVALRLGGEEVGPAGAKLRTDLGWLAGLLGRVRDLDVLTDRLGGEGATLPETDLPAFGEVLTALLAIRTTAADGLGQALGKQRYQALLRALAEQAAPCADDPPVIGTATAADLIRGPLRTVHQQMAATAQSPSDAAWHSLRIGVKRVRYAAELAGRLAGRKQAAKLAELASAAKLVQDVLGEFQDTVAAEDHLRGLATAHPDAQSQAATLVVGRLIERQTVRRDEIRPTLPGACGDLYRLSARLA